MKVAVPVALLTMGVALPAWAQQVPEGELPPLGTGPSEQTGVNGALGDYSVSRDGSGTSWQPDSSPHEGIHDSFGPWSTMIHSYAFGIYDHQGGKRGDDKLFSESMLMGMAQRPLDFGQLSLRAMISL